MFETVWGRSPRQRDHDSGNRRRCCGVVSLEFRQVAKQSLLGFEDLCTPAVRWEWTHRDSVFHLSFFLGDFGQVPKFSPCEPGTVPPLGRETWTLCVSSTKPLSWWYRCDPVCGSQEPEIDLRDWSCPRRREGTNMWMRSYHGHDPTVWSHEPLFHHVSLEPPSSPFLLMIFPWVMFSTHTTWVCNQHKHKTS